MLDLLQSSPSYLGLSALLFGLVVGSFLNVVIYRLPIMMERDYKSQAIDYLSSLEDSTLNIKRPEPTEGDGADDTFNLVLPHSSCPHCGHKITALENIPILSYLFLRGKCSNCKNSISIRYPLVELFTGLISLFLAYYYGFSWQLGAALILTYALISQALIDWDTQYLLDDITYPLLWIGLLVNSYGVFASLEDAVLGAILGYLSLWSVFWTYKQLTGKEGMGHGDFKLLAMLGAWVGFQHLPLIILMSSVLGSLVGSLILLRSKENDSGTPISFGPYLAISGWIALLWGERIVNAYLSLLSV